jgi:hypothetical protein
MNRDEVSQRGAAPYRTAPPERQIDYCEGAEIKLSWWQRYFALPARVAYGRIRQRRIERYVGDVRYPTEIEPIVLLTCPICGDEATLDFDTNRLERHRRRYACANPKCQGQTVAKLLRELAVKAEEFACARCGSDGTTSRAWPDNHAPFDWPTVVRRSKDDRDGPGRRLYYRRADFAGICQDCAEAYQYSEACGGNQTPEQWVKAQADPQPGREYAFGGPGEGWVNRDNRWYCCHECADTRPIHNPPEEYSEDA